jgi:uncharacterized linocin/CFP29 family protein
MTDMFRREMAPIADEAWQEIELQSSRLLKGNLSARRLVDFSGPHGLQFAGVNEGRLAMGEPLDGLGWGLNTVLPLVEIRVPFSLSIWDLDNAARGAKSLELEPMIQAARKAALFEERAVYQGFAGAGIRGLLECSSHPAVALGGDANGFTETVELGLLALQEAEIGGPFALVLGTEPYKWLMIGDSGSYPLRKRIQALATGGIHWSPALEGGAVLSRRGGDFELTVGQDLAIGYKLHDAKKVELFFAESFTFRVLEPAAAVELRLGASR